MRPPECQRRFSSTSIGKCLASVQIERRSEEGMYIGGGVLVVLLIILLIYLLA